MSKPRDRFEDVALYQTWDDDYYRDDFMSIYDSVIGYVVDKIGLKEGDEILEAGCGPGVHTINMARRGLKCFSVDFSTAALDEAKRRLEAAGLGGRAVFQREDITEMTLADDSVDNIFCWGVIMHIPEPEKAIAELSRVLKPGGHLAISSCNANSLDKFLMEKVAYRFKRPRTMVDIGTSNLGRYVVFRENDEDLFVQALFPKKVTALFASHGLQQKSCVGTQFTELYTHFDSDRIRRMFSGWNRFWFRRVGAPQLCAEHLMILRKDQAAA